VTAQTPSPAQQRQCYPLGHCNPKASQNLHRLFQIVDTLKSSETTVNTALAAATHQTNRTLVTMDIFSRPVPSADHRIPYGAGPSQFGDLWIPQTRSRSPLVVFLHGGWWQSEYDLGYAGHLCAALKKEGTASWSVEYRRVGKTGGGWPATFQDVAAGFDFHVPQVLIQGAADDQIPPELPSRWNEMSRRLGDNATVSMIPSADHFDVVDPESMAWGTVRDSVRKMAFV
jgi:hypothetical protein